MTMIARKGQIPHTEWLDLKGNGVLVECAILKRDDRGNRHFITIPDLDDIDKRRLVSILNNRNVNNFELWDLMSQITLNNGVNALQYFHQLVKVATNDGVIMNPREGHVGIGKIPVGNARQGTASDTAKAQKDAEKTGQ